MKQLYDGIWSVTSEKDLVGIVQYIAADSPSNAFEIFKEIKQKAKAFMLSLIEAGSPQSFEIKKLFYTVS